MLFTERSIWTMIHGIGLGGTFLLAFSSVFHCLWSMRSTTELSPALVRRQCRFLAGATTLMAAVLWLTIGVGVFVSFPAYRANPPDGTTDLTPYPKAVLKADPDHAWLHEIGMEMKEHMPWVAAILMTAVAFVAVSQRSKIIEEVTIRNTMLILLSLTFSIVSLIALAGVFINKVAPLV